MKWAEEERGRGSERHEGHATLGGEMEFKKEKEGDAGAEGDEGEGEEGSEEA